MKLTSPLLLFPRLLLLTSHLSLLALLLFSPAFAQQRWEKTYGGAGDDVGESVRQTTDGGYIVAGGTNSFGSDYQVYLIKADSLGDTVWTKTYGVAGYEYGRCVRQTLEGGFIIAGNTNSFGDSSQVYLIKTNGFGDTCWTRTYGGERNEIGHSVQQTTDGGYVIVGETWTFGPGTPEHPNVYLIKTDTLGDTLWTKTYGGTGSGNEIGYSVQRTTDGGYIIAGYSNSFGAGSGDVYLIKTDALGVTLWTRTYGGSIYADCAYSVSQNSDNGYIVTGFSWSISNPMVYLIRTDESGDTLWTRTYSTNWRDVGYSVQQTLDGGFIIAGESMWFAGRSTNVLLIKTGANGDRLWDRGFGRGTFSGGYSLQQTIDGGYIIAGSLGANGYADVYLIKTDANGNVGVEGFPGHQSRITSYSVFPNPFTSFATVPGHASDRFALYDISGRKVGVYQGDSIGWDVSPGVYFLRPDTRPPQPDTRILRIVKLK